MFGGIKLKTLLSTPEEWHALVIGFCLGFCPWAHRLIPINRRSSPIKGEEHYFVAGLVPGFVAMVFFWLGIAKFIREVLL